MKLDELAFFNQQLAGMLRSGIPLEGSLRQLSKEMRRGQLRAEVEALERDLASGIPLAEAISKRRLPLLYAQMLRLGAASNNLPAVLTVLADYYHKANATWSRLKTLLIYPGIVLAASLVLSIALAMVFSHVVQELAGIFGEFAINPGRMPRWFRLVINLWYPVLLIGLVALAFISLWIFPRFRHWMRWRFPGFKEASLSQTASGIALMLENGSTLNQTLDLVRQVEDRSPAEGEIARWQRRLAEGRKQFADIAADGKLFPPMFIWLVSGSGEDWISGFRQAAEVYYARSIYKIELMLYAVLPVAILALGILIITQVVPLARLFFGAMAGMTSMDNF